MAGTAKLVRLVRRRVVIVVMAFSAALAPAGAAAAFPATGGPAGTGTGVACSVPTGTWPMYQGGPTHAADACSSIDPGDVAGLRPSWFTPTPGIVTGTPAVAFGSVFAGDYTGRFYALDEDRGAVRWTFDTVAPHDCFLDTPVPHADSHQVSFGEIPASPATATVGGRRVVFVAAGGSLFALDAAGGRCLWAQDVDPAHPSSATEIESSPVVDTAVDPPEVLVGDDDNGSTGVSVTGLMAFNAATGALLWKYQPERDTTLTPAEFSGSAAMTLSCGDGAPDPDCSPDAVKGLAPDDAAHADACGDVWSSPALDTGFVDPGGSDSFEGSAPEPPPGWAPKTVTATGRPSADGLVVFGTGDCSARPDPAAALAHGDYVDNESVFALDPVTGVRVWNFVEPPNDYANNPIEPGGGDDDFGSSPIVAALPAGSVPASKCPTTTLVIEGSKSGFAYGLCAADGRDVWAVQAAQAGQLSPDTVGSVGGFIGSPSLGSAGGRPAAFFTSAIPTPFANDGVREPGDGDSNLAACPGLEPLPALPACPDLTLSKDPERLVSLHAIDAATGAVIFQAPSLPTYAASTYTNHVVFVPDSVGASVLAFDTDTGLPIWAFPLAATPASGASVAGGRIFLGTGEEEAPLGSRHAAPPLSGVWSFSIQPQEVAP